MSVPSMGRLAPDHAPEASRLDTPAIGHYCATHIFDDQCEAAPSSCRGFCGADISDHGGFGEGDDDCVVCLQMCETRGDFDLNNG